MPPGSPSLRPGLCLSRGPSSRLPTPPGSPARSPQLSSLLFRTHRTCTAAFHLRCLLVTARVQLSSGPPAPAGPPVPGRARLLLHCVTFRQRSPTLLTNSIARDTRKQGVMRPFGSQIAHVQRKTVEAPGVQAGRQAEEAPGTCWFSPDCRRHSVFNMCNSHCSCLREKYLPAAHHPPHVIRFRFKPPRWPFAYYLRSLTLIRKAKSGISFSF